MIVDVDADIFVDADINVDAVLDVDDEVDLNVSGADVNGSALEFVATGFTFLALVSVDADTGADIGADAIGIDELAFKIFFGLILLLSFVLLLMLLEVVVTGVGIDADTAVVVVAISVFKASVASFTLFVFDSLVDTTDTIF